MHQSLPKEVRKVNDIGENRWKLRGLRARQMYLEVSVQQQALSGNNGADKKSLDLHTKHVQKSSISTQQRYPISVKPNLGRVVMRSGLGPTGI